MAKISRVTYEARRYAIEEAYRRILAEVDRQISFCKDPTFYHFKRTTEDIGKYVAKQMRRHMEQMDREEAAVEPLDFAALLPENGGH